MFTGGGATLAPPPFFSETDALVLEPMRMSDSTVMRQPILTDRSASLNDPNPLQAGEAHPYGGRLKNTNLLFGDGHVETHKAQLVQMRYRGNYYNFY